KDRLTRLEQKLEALSGPQAAAAPEANAAPAAADGAAGAGRTASQGAPPMTAPDPTAAFLTARRAFSARDFATAETGFRDYIDRFGETARAPEARYYLAKALMERQD